MSPPEQHSLREALAAAGSLEGRWLKGGSEDIPLSAILAGTCFVRRTPELTGRSVLVATANQLSAGLALIELDGIARRLTLLPPDFKPAHLRSIVQHAEIDAIVSSGQP